MFILWPYAGPCSNSLHQLYSRCSYVCIPMCPWKKSKVVNPEDVSAENTDTKREQDASEFRLPEYSESTTVLVGAVNFLKKPISIFVRLADACYLGNLIEINVPVRFLFVFLGPEEEQHRYKETGRSIAAMMSDKSFLSLAYQFKVCLNKEILVQSPLVAYSKFRLMHGFNLSQKILMLI